MSEISISSGFSKQSITSTSMSDWHSSKHDLPKSIREDNIVTFVNDEQPEKQQSPIWITEDGILISSSEVHLEKLDLPISIIVSGRFIFFIVENPSNADSLICIALIGSMISVMNGNCSWLIRSMFSVFDVMIKCFNWLQFENELFWTFVTYGFIMILFNDEHPMNEWFPINKTDSGIVTSFNDEHPAKA